MSDTKALPGWGVEGGTWEEIDRLNEEELAAAEAALLAGGGDASRIAAQVQQLSLGGEGEAGGSGGTPGEEEVEEVGQQGQYAASDGGGDSEDDDEGWETAAKSNSAVRKQRRRGARREAWEARQAEAAAAAAAEQQEQRQQETEDEEGGSGSEEEGEEDGEEEGEEEGEGSLLGSDDEATRAKAGDAPAGAFESSVSIQTADFAMQNTIMQMGLRLVATDGRRVTQLSRWVLRCTACSAVTKEMGRLFCPRCGNAALARVQVVVGADGAEQYGVRRKHVLRGTRFPLPKPRVRARGGEVGWAGGKWRPPLLLVLSPRPLPRRHPRAHMQGGRHRDLILREDQLLTKKHLLRAKKKQGERGGGAGSGTRRRAALAPARPHPPPSPPPLLVQRSLRPSCPTWRRGGGTRWQRCRGTTRARPRCWRGGSTTPTSASTWPPTGGASDAARWCACVDLNMACKCIRKEY